MKKTKKLLTTILTLAMSFTATLAFVSCDLGYTTTETDNLIATLQTKIDNNKNEVNEEITALKEEYKTKDNELLAQITANQQAITAIQTEYTESISTLQLVAETNATAINELKAEYLATIEELAQADSANATALAELKTTYESKVAELTQADSGNKKAIEDLTAEYVTKIEELAKADSDNAKALTELKTTYESKVTALEKADNDNKKLIEDLTAEYTKKVQELENAIATANATIESNQEELNNAISVLTSTYESKVAQIDTLLKTLQNTDTTQDEKIAELVNKITTLEQATRITDIQFTDNGDLIITFGDGSTQTVIAPKKEIFTVTFNPNNGEDTFVQNVEEGGKALVPTAPTKDGYDFLGWYINDDEWSFVGYSVTEDIELVAVWEETYTKGLEFYYLEDGTYGVKAGQAEYLEDIVIPSVYKGVAVTCILPNAFQDSHVKTIVLPNTIETIGVSAFENCCNLSHIDIPENVTIIESRTFAGCKALTVVNIPANVTTIKSYAFYDSGVEQIYLANAKDWNSPSYTYTLDDINDKITKYTYSFEIAENVAKALKGVVRIATYGSYRGEEDSMGRPIPTYAYTNFTWYEQDWTKK